jgi:hypothetical protein
MLDLDFRELDGMVTWVQDLEAKVNEKKGALFTRLTELIQSEISIVKNANADGKVVELTDAVFTSATATKPWFIKFFAPWCRTM